eukprot:TRINITY_DN21383_c0_g1_i1.p1 TRINITY_DN21383_c0_g1~~TRINITY_DN21383_c0_g1_i1.p1  ORF type:complete len:1237 (+),score=290.65 TRINITY_DN21383_c0_g1_i1:149-3859(+)
MLGREDQRPFPVEPVAASAGPVSTFASLPTALVDTSGLAISVGRPHGASFSSLGPTSELPSYLAPQAMHESPSSAPAATDSYQAPFVAQQDRYSTVSFNGAASGIATSFSTALEKSPHRHLVADGAGASMGHMPLSPASHAVTLAPTPAMVASPSARCSTMDDLSSLQRRLQSESAERQQSLQALMKVRKVVALFRQQVHAATETKLGDPVAQHLRDLTDTMDMQVRNACSCSLPMSDFGFHSADVPLREHLGSIGSLSFRDRLLSEAQSGQGSPTHASYESIRQSLREAQRRCESLNAELRKQTDAHADVSCALTSAKETNKRLTEQLRQQCEEMATQARQKLSEEQHSEELRRRRRLEDDQKERERTRHAAQELQDAEHKLEDLQRFYMVKVQRLKTGMEKLQRECSKLRADSLEQRCSAVSFGETTRELFKQTAHSLAQRIEAFNAKHIELQVSSNDAARDLEMRMKAEQEVHYNETQAWNQRYMAVAAERDELQARLVRDGSQLSLQLQQVENARDEARRVWAEERGHLIRQLEDIRKQAATLDAQGQKWAQDLQQAEAARGQLELESHRVKLELTDFQRQARECRDALMGAELVKQGLQEQLEEQRRRMTHANDTALTSCRELSEQRLSLLAEEGRVSLASAVEKLQQAEAQTRAVESALAAAQIRCDAEAEAAQALRSSLEAGKADLQDAATAKSSLEAQLSASESALHQERRNLEEIELERKVLKTELQSANDKIIDNTRSFEEKEAMHIQVAGVLEASIRDRDHRLEERQKQLAESVQAQAASRQALAEAHAESRHLLTESQAEASSQQKRIADFKASLEKCAADAAEDKRRSEEERRRLEETLADQAKAAMEAQGQFERWREANLVSLQQEKNDGLAKLTKLDQEREKLRSECNERGIQLAEMKGRLDTAEEDIKRVRYLLSESQDNMSNLRLEYQRDEQLRTAESQQLQQEIKQVSASLQTALQSEATITKKLEDAFAQHLEEERKLEREVAEAKRVGEQMVVEREQRLERLRTECDSRVKAIEARCARELERENSRVDTLLRENDQLKRLVAEQRQNSAQGMNSLQHQLEEHIQRLQQHTSDLRVDLNRSGSSLQGSSPAKRDLSASLLSPHKGVQQSTAAEQLGVYAAGSSSSLLGLPNLLSQNGLAVGLAATAPSASQQLAASHLAQEPAAFAPFALSPAAGIHSGSPSISFAQAYPAQAGTVPPVPSSLVGPLRLYSTSGLG